MDRSDRIKNVTKTIVIDAPVQNVYKFWTTEKGIETFFGAKSKVEFRKGGPIEIYFLFANKFRKPQLSFHLFLF